MMGRKLKLDIGKTYNGYKILKNLGLDEWSSMVYVVLCKHCKKEKNMKAYNIKNDMSHFCKCGRTKNSGRKPINPFKERDIELNTKLLDQAMRDYEILANDIKYRAEYQGNNYKELE
jgi:hypothetical protein